MLTLHSPHPPHPLRTIYSTSDTFSQLGAFAPRKSKVGLVHGSVMHVMPALTKVVNHAILKKDRALKVVRVEIEGEKVIGVKVRRKKGGKKRKGKGGEGFLFAWLAFPLFSAVDLVASIWSRHFILFFRVVFPSFSPSLFSFLFSLFSSRSTSFRTSRRNSPRSLS